MASLKPKKHLGQNFLIDPNYLRKIVAACDLQKNDNVLEIGPGKGVLTKAIAPWVQSVVAVETDGSLVNHLQGELSSTTPHVQIIHQDFLKFDLQTLPDNMKVIGNLPYYIVTPIIEKLLQHLDKFPESYFTVQWEYGQRMTAKPGTKAYGAFTCFVQFFSEPEILFKIPSTAFHPAPKVQSCFIKLTRRKASDLSPDHIDLLFKIIHQAFQQRRKTLPNSLSSLIEKVELQGLLRQLGLDPKLRAENLSLDDYIQLTQRMAADRRGRSCGINSNL